MTGQGGSTKETEQVIESLETVGFCKERILGVVFDTTAVNTGYKTGITV